MLWNPFILSESFKFNIGVAHSLSPSPFLFDWGVLKYFDDLFDYLLINKIKKVLFTDWLLNIVSSLNLALGFLKIWILFIFTVFLFLFLLIFLWTYFLLFKWHHKLWFLIHKQMFIHINSIIKYLKFSIKICSIYLCLILIESHAEYCLPYQLIQ